MSLASKHPQRVKFMVLTNPYLWKDDAVAKAKREAESAGENMSDGQWGFLADGSHFTNVWDARKAWLSPELNTRCTLDDCTYRMKRNARYQLGVNIQPPQLFEFTDCAGRITCPVLVLFGGNAVEFFDMIGLAMTEQSKKAVASFTAVSSLHQHTIPGGSINMLNEKAAEWVAAVSEALW